MIAAHIIRFTTPKGVELQGIWYGSTSPKSVYIVIHGLGSNIFSNIDLFTPLAQESTAVFMFNNRGHDKVTRVRKIDKRKKKGYRSIQAGAAHEVFTDCVDDIAGAVQVVKKRRPHEIHLIGHSTGCQKAVYFSYKSPSAPIVKLILLSPLSDSAGIKATMKPHDLSHLQQIAQEFITQGYPHALLPVDLWPSLDDAQRFMSLSSPESAEEVFPYAYPDIAPLILKRIKHPILVILGSKDEYRDRPIKSIGKWFEDSLNNGFIEIINNADHSFSQHQSQTRKIITSWIKRY